jgi:hypothetical protein
MGIVITFAQTFGTLDSPKSRLSRITNVGLWLPCIRHKECAAKHKAQLDLQILLEAVVVIGYLLTRFVCAFGEPCEAAFSLDVQFTVAL